MGAELLEYLLTGQNPGFSAERLKRSTALLLNDLLRRDEGMATFEAGLRIAYGNGKSVTAPILAECKGRKFVIALSGPLTTGHPADPAIAEFRDSGTEYQVIVENELVIRGNLPTATRTIYQQITG